MEWKLKTHKVTGNNPSGRVKDSFLEIVCFDFESTFKETHVNRGTFSMKKACPILAQCVTFMSTKNISMPVSGQFAWRLDGPMSLS